MSTKPPQNLALHHTLRLWLLSIRDMLASAGPLLFVGIGLLIAAYWWLDPQPPRDVTLATGPAGSADAEFGKRYVDALAKNGITVHLLTTQGSTTNLSALRDWGLRNVYEIYPVWRHRYAPGVTHNTEHVFGLTVPPGTPVVLAPREHLQHVWLPWREAADRCFSPSNAEAILQLPRRSGIAPG